MRRFVEARPARSSVFAGCSVKRMKGLEPSTFCMASRRSSQLSYIRASAQYRSSGRVARAPVGPLQSSDRGPRQGRGPHEVVSWRSAAGPCGVRWRPTCRGTDARRSRRWSRSIRSIRCSNWPRSVRTSSRMSPSSCRSSRWPRSSRSSRSRTSSRSSQRVRRWRRQPLPRRRARRASSVCVVARWCLLDMVGHALQSTPAR
jgi:hypothetical protein